MINLSEVQNYTFIFIFANNLQFFCKYLHKFVVTIFSDTWKMNVSVSFFAPLQVIREKMERGGVARLKVIFREKRC